MFSSTLLSVEAVESCLIQWFNASQILPKQYLHWQICADGE